MAGGYDDFFKNARKASGVSEIKPKTAAQIAAQNAKLNAKNKKSTGRINFKFPLKQDTPEDRLRAELATRMQNRKRLAKGRRAKFPIGAAVSAVVMLVVCGLGYFYADQSEALLSRTFGRFDIGIFGQAEAESKTDKKASKADEKSAEKAHGKEAAKADESKKADAGEASEKTETASNLSGKGDPIDTKKWTPEELSFLGKLNDRKKELDLREIELGKLEEELQKRKSELDEKLKQLEAMRTDISKTLKTRVASDQEKIDKLVQVYSVMKPQQASKIIETLDEDLAVEILDKMKKKSAADVLDMMDPKKARRLSELSAGYERSTASVQSSQDDASGGESAPAAAPKK